MKETTMSAEEYERIISHARMSQEDYDKQMKVAVQCHTIEGWQHAKFCRNAMDADAYIQSLPKELRGKMRTVAIPVDKYWFYKS
jgi:hypothetical protein